MNHILVAAPHEGLAGVSMQLSRIEGDSGAPVIVPLILGTWCGSLGPEAAPQVHWLLTVQVCGGLHIASCYVLQQALCHDIPSAVCP